MRDGDILRDARWADLPRIVEIYNAAIPGRMSTADLEPVTVGARRKWFEEHRADSRPLWVLERDGEIVAWIGLQSFYGRPAYIQTAEFSLYVAPTHQGQGLGSALLRRLIEQSRELGVRTLVAFIFGHNAPSLRMCEKAGFQRWGCLPEIALLDGVRRDLVILGLTMSSV